MSEANEVLLAAQEALADLTARADDLKRGTHELGNEQFLSALQAFETADEAVLFLTGLVAGYGNLATKMLVEWSRSSRRSTEELLAGLGGWVSNLKS